MPQMQHADRVRSALADTWPDQTSTPAVPASAPSILPPASSAEPCVQLLNRFMDKNDAFSPGMPGIKNLALLPNFGTVGATPPSRTIIVDHIRAAGASARPQCQTFLDAIPLAKEKLMAA